PSGPGAPIGDFTGPPMSGAPAGAPDPCGPPGRFWVNAEHLLWFIREGRVPPLVSVGPVASGAILVRGASVVFGPGSDLDNPTRPGGRFAAGLWLNEEQTWGIEAGYFFLGHSGKDFSLAGTGAPGTSVIGRPFFNPITGAEDAAV